jgi:hypothetical protein
MDQEQDYTWIRGVRDALLTGELVEPPDWVRIRARQLIRSGGARRAADALLDRVRAALVFDSRRASPMRAGVRSSALIEGPWHLLYRGGDVDIDLLVRPNQDGRTATVRGQALSLAGACIDAGVVEALPAGSPPLQGDAQPLARSELEPTGEFALANLVRGRYDVHVRFGARKIELSGVEL